MHRAFKLIYTYEHDVALGVYAARLNRALKYSNLITTVNKLFIRFTRLRHKMTEKFPHRIIESCSENVNEQKRRVASF